MSDWSDLPSGQPPRHESKTRPATESTAGRSSIRLPTLLKILVWGAVLALSTFVAVSNHWAADMILGVLPLGGFALFIGFGLVALLRRR